MTLTKIMQADAILQEKHNQNEPKIFFIDLIASLSENNKVMKILTFWSCLTQKSKNSITATILLQDEPTEDGYCI